MQDRVEHELEHLRDWDLEDLQELFDKLGTLIHRQEKAKSLYSILDFEGTFQGCWDEVGGVDEFIKQERASWGV